MLTRLLINFGMLFALDLYTWQAFRTLFPDKPWIKYAYWGFHALIYAAMMLIGLKYGMKPSRANWGAVFFSFVIALYIPKIIISLFLLIEDVTRAIRWLVEKSGVKEPSGEAITRKDFVSKLAMGVAAVPFLATIYGIVKGKYDYQVRKVKVPIANLPEEFVGFTIAQISDLHTGSFDNKEAVAHGMDMINAQNADMIVFTGDLINNHIDEVQGFESIYSRLKAKEGVFAVLGNHDYSEYIPWESKAAKDAHHQQVIGTHGKYGWKLLLNENHLIQRGDSSLALIGIENWSAKPYFPKYGDLGKAYKGVENSQVKVLLSHDPSHWTEEVTSKFPQIDLTLSGHTHGMQFGIDIPGFKWSPVQYAYKEWADLYTQGKQHLYVNRGFGFLGFSGRVGILPEITVLELVKA